MKKIFSFITLFVSLSIIGAEITGEVVKVIDGDTVIIQNGDDRFKVRLAHIDAPELSQDCGQHAKMTLSILCESKKVYIEFHQIDMYGRIVGTIYLGKAWNLYLTNINKAMVEHGCAWWYEEFSNDPEYAALQAKAKQEGIGVWAKHWETCIPPWEYRKINQKYRKKDKKIITQIFQNIVN